MMNYKNMQRLIDNTNYWDARVEAVECNHFSDEVMLSFKDNNNSVVYKFTECYKVSFDHVKNYKKNMPVKNMSYSQIPYFLTDINVSEVFEQGDSYIKCDIVMFPLNIEIWCKDIVVDK